MPFADLWDFYRQVRVFIGDLARAGETEWSATLDTAMYGSTSGEIFTYLLLHLQQLHDTDVPRRLGKQREVDEMIRWLREVVM